MKLYQTPTSPNALRVRLVIFELGLDVDYINVNTREGENRTPEFLAMAPNGKIPVLVDGDFVLWESRAITGYLGTICDGGRLVPSDPKSRALVDQWSYWQAMQFGPAMHAVNRQHVQLPAMGQEGNADLAAKNRETVNSLLPVFESGISGKDWIVGDLSVADFALASTFTMWEKAEFDLDPFPGVKAWVRRMEARPSFGTVRDALWESIGLS